MQKDYSPFTPGQPVDPQFFVGRKEQVERLIQRAQSALAGRVEIVFVSGERGIGKTSLSNFARLYAETQFKMLTAYVHLGGVHDLSEAVRLTFQRLLQEGIDKPWYDRLKELFKHVRQVGLFGVVIEFVPPHDELQSLVRGFTSALKQICDRMANQRKGLMLVLDDINGLATQREFADWLKKIPDESANLGQLPLCIVLVGLEDFRRDLIRNNESLARVLFPIDIPLWKEDECIEFFRKSFERVNVQVSEDALETMERFSGGHPALAHEIGDAVFRVDNDNFIDFDDTFNGIVQAAEIMGRKYLEPQVFQAIRSPRYRKILQLLAHRFTDWRFQRSDIIGRLSPDERKVFNNFLNRMRKLGVIVPDEEGGRGAYRFRNLLHFLYFGMEARPQIRRSR